MFNSLQGVFIFVFFAASQSDVRRTISTTIRGTSSGNSSNRQPNSSSTGGVKSRDQHSRGGGPNLPGVQSFDMFACTPPVTSTPTWARSDVQVDDNPQPTPPATRARAEPPASGIHEDNMFRGNTPPPSTPQRDKPVGVRDDGIMLQHPPPPPTPPRGRDNPAVEMDNGETMKTFGVDENGSN